MVLREYLIIFPLTSPKSDAITITNFIILNVKKMLCQLLPIK